MVKKEKNRGTSWKSPIILAIPPIQTIAPMVFWKMKNNFARLGETSNSKIRISLDTHIVSFPNDDHSAGQCTWPVRILT